jgi:hypothetical protein
VPTVSNPPIITASRHEPFTPDADRGVRGGPPRWLGGLALGVFVGLVGLLGVYLLTRDPDDGGNTTSTTTASSQPVVDQSTTVPSEQFPALLAQFINERNASDRDLSWVGNSVQNVEQCAAFLSQTEITYGVPTTTDSAVPANLEPALAELPPDAQELARSLVDTVVRRYQACVAVDQAAYDELKAREDQLTEQLTSLT